MNCEICYKTGIKADGRPGGLDCPGVCGACRRHAQIGAAVERMPLFAILEHSGHGKMWWYGEATGDSMKWNTSPDPLSALRAAGLVKEEEKP